ncbi:NAD(P) transhydrogenase subunit alpha [Leptospira semungkisensis]|uniref:proton-translocating NAD(P)(+) transhydrogenase n=2 Tax=Leptospira TaxID=171 RepID=A0A5F1ZX19_9LEPT|nr:MULTISPECIES: NAD(P) transhydrogenase subunit alpha [Leptospira]TGK01425.1 NAD(P) transhydrogenase subunit alpha [Leptospira langatensis]TGK07384.1 NAD(P) transhydrogenase subunit alpha [Leptospira semungkisensis]TGL42125.1 NAD(P) transhydrogenase subunit alpha [Leptospira langatensis]
MEQFVSYLTIFLIAVFVGIEVINRIPPLLHTPLMSGSNAISGITIIGAILTLHASHSWIIQVLGFIAIVGATINVIGGFVVTHRMLGMFKKKD